MNSTATSTKESDEVKVGMCVDLEVRETGHVNGEEEDETALQEMVTPLSLTDLAKPSNLELLSKHRKAPRQLVT